MRSCFFLTPMGCCHVERKVFSHIYAFKFFLILDIDYSHAKDVLVSYLNCFQVKLRFNFLLSLLENYRKT